MSHESEILSRESDVDGWNPVVGVSDDNLSCN
jgi:hypothetical protein